MSINIAERQFDYRSQRERWQVDYKRDDLLTAAQSKVGYHTRHYNHWKAEEERLGKKLKESVKVREIAVTGGVQHQAEMDGTISQQYGLAKSKRVSHQDSLATFEAWVTFFVYSPPGRSFAGTQADASFFGMGQTTQEIEDD